MPQLSERERRRIVHWGTIALILIVLVVILIGTLGPYVDYLWYADDVRHPRVFTLAYETKGLLFLPAFLLTWALLHFSLKRALRLSLVYIDSPSTRGQVLISNALHFVQDRGWSLVRVAAPVFAFFSAIGFSNEWNTMLLARNGGAFGVRDPLYGLDLSFFVFTLPWLRALVNYAFGVFLLATILTVAVYAGLQLLASLAKIELGRPNVRMHIGILTGITILLLAAQLYLKSYEFGLVANGQFTGAGFAATYQLFAQRIVAGLIALFALAIIALSRASFVYQLMLKGGAAAAAAYLLGVLVIPAVVQKVMVEPDKLTKESPFATRAIKMTRFGYALDRIRPYDFPVQDVPSPEALRNSKATLDNMRLWDPKIVQQSVEVLQGLKPYYTFSDVDVDRYLIGGKPTEVMLSPRDITLSGLAPSARTWVNERLVFTHGFGVIMTDVNSSSTDGEPKFLIENIPPTTLPDIPLTEPRIYFSDFRDSDGLPTDQYAIVDTNQPEFDYPAQDKSATYRWKGSSGIPIAGFFRRLALSIILGDGNLLVSGNITGQSRLLVHRGVIDRCRRLYPFLKLDDDPYIVLLNGKVYWMLDAYTTTDRIPYSELSQFGDGSINYIRNSVKIVIDAYSGDTTAYAVEPNEPILKAYRRIYPGLIRDLAELPPGFKEHFRYPEDLFVSQSFQLAQYHVSDPIAFLNNNDAWEMPRQRGPSGDEAYLPPYFVQMQLPGEARQGFILMLPFTPRGKPNMSGWLAAHCDPGRYGELTLYNFAKGANVAGAEQMETTFAGDPKVNSAILQLEGGGQTEVVVGNMLVIPIGKSVMYAESLFPISRASGLQAMPRLKKVVLGLNGRIEIGDTYRDALDKLFGPAATPTVTGAVPTAPTPTPPTQRPPSGVREALDLLDKADKALRDGDFAAYGKLEKQAREKLRSLMPRP